MFSVRKRNKRKSPPTGGQAGLCTVHSVVSILRSKHRRLVDCWSKVGRETIIHFCHSWLAAKGQWWAELVAVRAKIWHRWENVCINTHTYSLYEKLRYPSISGVQKSWFVYEGSVCRSSWGLELAQTLWDWYQCACLSCDAYYTAVARVCVFGGEGELGSVV